MNQQECNNLCDTMYKIRDMISSNDSISALSLANDLYFNLLRITIQDVTIDCKGCENEYKIKA